MARFIRTIFISVVEAGLLGCVAVQRVHVVGDSLGWTVAQGGAAIYSNWANGKTFAVRDITNEHDVLRVQKTTFDACTLTNAIGDAIMTGPTNITLTSRGEHYDICTIGRQFGQWLAIIVSSGNSGGIPPSTTPAPLTTPTVSTTPPPPGSSASSIFASTSVSMLAITMGLLL